MGAANRPLSLPSTTWALQHLEEPVEINSPLCLLVPIPDSQWRTRGWTFLQQSVISCPRAPRTSSPAPWAPVAWIAPASGKAAPPTTSKALRLVLFWPNTVAVHGRGASGGCSSWKRDPLWGKGWEWKMQSRRPHSCFLVLCPRSKWGGVGGPLAPALLRHQPLPDCPYGGRGGALKPSSCLDPPLPSFAPLSK